MTENERRKFLKASLASLAGAVGVSIPGCEKKEEGQVLPCYYGHDDDLRYEKKDETPPPEPESDDAASDQPARNEEFAKWQSDMEARREKLTEELKELKPLPPKSIPDGAMCYSF